MKLRKIAVLVMILVVSLGSCSLFGPSKSNILSWWPDDTNVGDKLVYSWTGLLVGGGTETGTEVNEILDIDERKTKTVIRTTNGYMVIDDIKEVIALGDDDIVDEYDMVILKVPVEAGTIWTSDEVLLIDMDDSQYEITATKQSLEAAGKVYKDAVHVTITDPDYTDAIAVYEYYWSPSAGLLQIHLKMKPPWNWNGYSEYTYTLSSIE